MDHLVCGDVGFGKTEVALRAAFMAVMGGYQVAVLTEPFDASPGGNITDQREVRENALGFSLKISRRPSI